MAWWHTAATYCGRACVIYKAKWGESFTGLKAPVRIETPPEKLSKEGSGALLKLKRVEIQGFKSFYDRTEMKFNGSGIAAVVGPNGCGKSNLSDAISWVLGEQSAKSLRGARMEDVIFAGTRERKPLGLASVTMTLIPAHPAHQPLNGDGSHHHHHDTPPGAERTAEQSGE